MESLLDSLAQILGRNVKVIVDTPSGKRTRHEHLPKLVRLDEYADERIRTEEEKMAHPESSIITFEYTNRNHKVTTYRASWE